MHRENVPVFRSAPYSQHKSPCHGASFRVYLTILPVDPDHALLVHQGVYV